MTVTIRAGTAADLESIMPVMQAAFPAETGEAWTLTQCSGALALSGTALTVATMNRNGEEQSCGFAIVRTVLDEAELLLIAVAIDAQRLGVGTRLLNHVEALARAKGVRKLHVEVRHDNSALSFYDCHGFIKVGERSNYYRRRDGQVGTALTLVKAIS
jgi:[ribosomal protein S18]-alanine N-acetyltransferase